MDGTLAAPAKPAWVRDNCDDAGYDESARQSESAAHGDGGRDSSKRETGMKNETGANQRPGDRAL